MTDKSREQFEAWYQGDMNWKERFHRDDSSKRSYSFSGTEKAWQAWTAGRKALLAELKAAVDDKDLLT